jgi:hypothetical protein
MFNILNSDANIAIKVDIGVHFVLKHIKMRVLEYVLLPEKAIYWRFLIIFANQKESITHYYI